MRRVIEAAPIDLEELRALALDRFLREIARAREVVVDFLAGDNVYGSTAESLQRYFDAFALAARRRRP